MYSTRNTLKIIKNTYIKIITNFDIGLKGRERIYISESLTPHYRKLLKTVKEMAKLKEYKFVWWKNDRILVRKEERSPVIVIEKEEDLKKLN